MSSDFVVRIIGMIVLGFFAAYTANSFGGGIFPEPRVLYVVIISLLGALIGLVLTPYLTTRPVRALRALLARIDAQTLAASLIGLIVGLIIAALLAFPLSLLPPPFGEVLPFIGVMLVSYFGVAVFVMRQNDIFSVFRDRLPRRRSGEEGEEDTAGRKILVDTSVIIDGRIADIARTGFLSGTLLIPRFVLNELQYIADSADSLRRQRGRRGMEILSHLQDDATMPVQISDIDVEGTREVDDKLVILARQLKCPVLTNDYNLNRVAELQGVLILNVNELANAVKAVLLPGESLVVDIIQEGKEVGQGVGYLDDGTMVVVEDGSGHLHKETYVTVTKVLQTAAGRMIFARTEAKS
ncbi:MAG: PIN domain nuclease [Anaerolineae bacterium]|nr:PIN domain nuclease [Anaerolineae bacterium]